MHPLPIHTLGALVSKNAPCVVLDTARPSAGQHFSFVFTRPIRTHVCPAAREVPGFLRTIAREAARFWTAGFLNYEAAYGLEERLINQSKRFRNVAWFGVFPEPFIFDHCTGRWNRPIPLDKARHDRNSSGISLRHSILQRRYTRAIDKIRRYISAGDIYQANFTYDVFLKSKLSPWELYLALRQQQPVPFGAFIDTGKKELLSFSPELFFVKHRNRITVRPMKGTAPRGRTTAEDRQIAAALAADPKNRSENVMIVDLLRNDLGKICETGFVTTKSLFDVERHPSLFQMTSTIEGSLQKGTGFADIMTALFPSGSVTGTPKIRAMEILAGLESGPRGVYCGAIGYTSPKGAAVFSVPIRTLQKKSGDKNWRYRVGSGIVWDSSAREEWKECLNKCDFLIDHKPAFRIFESLLFVEEGRFRFLKEHWQRLSDSAGYFNFPADRSEWDKTVNAVYTKLKTSKQRHKVGIFLDKAGIFAWDHDVLSDKTISESNKIIISKKLLDPSNIFLFHKTDYRPWYAPAVSAIRGKKVFDVIHVNKWGEITEGARSNIFVKIRGKLYTPPVECGLLPGVLRGRLIKSGKCSEKILHLKDLQKAGEVYCGNSVRGLVKVSVGSKCGKYFIPGDNQ
jgi:para-aminobenzoate synthetase/4-amino-4-deoxychorismate lyase